MEDILFGCIIFAIGFATYTVVSVLRSIEQEIYYLRQDLKNGNTGYPEPYPNPWKD